MFQVSTTPRASSARQIECVSCKEVFASHKIEPSSRAWSHNTPINDLNQLSEANQGILCPRCGTDNRHWEQITMPPPSLLKVIEGARHNFLLASFGPLITAVLGAFAIYTTPSAERLNTGNLIFYLCLILAGFLPTLGIITQWRDLRDYNNLKGFVHSQALSAKFSPTVKSGFKWVFILAFALPVCIFILLPAMVEVPSALLSSSPSSNLVDRIDVIIRELEPAIQHDPDTLVTVKTVTGSLEKLLEQYTLQCDPTRINASLSTLENELSKTDLPAARISLIQTAVSDLKVLQGLDEMHCDQTLVQYATESLKAIKIFDEDVCEGESVDQSDTTSRYRFCNSERFLNTIQDVLTQLENQTPVISGDEPLARALSALAGARHITNQSPGEEVNRWINNEVSTLESVIEQSRPLPDYQTNLPLVINWIKYVVAASVMTSLTALVAVNGYVKRVNAQLPRPIFHSVANMTRVVLGDLKRSLEISSDMSQIQWTSVERNEKGGLILKGVYREPVAQVNGEVLHKVRAQLYTITTDIWGCIESADIQTTTILPPPQSPDITMGNALFHQVIPNRSPTFRRTQ